MPLVGMSPLVAGPRPLPRQWATALTTYLPLDGPEWNADAKGVFRWLNGVRFLPFGCEKAVGVTFDPCVLRTTEYEEGFGDEVSFGPFMAEVAIECSTLGSSREELMAWVIAHTEVSRSSIMGAQVEHSEFNTSNPSLASEAQNVSNADQSLMGAVIAIEDALADLLDGGMGMIHMTPGLFAAYAAGGGCRYDITGKPMTPTGHYVVADAGYLGVSPATNTVVAGQKWIYGSGPVFARYAPLLNFTALPNEEIDFTRNNRLVQAIQPGIAIFEPCSVVAALIDTSDSDVVGE